MDQRDDFREAQDFVRAFVRAGYVPVRQFADELAQAQAIFDVDAALLRPTLDEALAALRDDEAGWRDATINDRLTAAFAALEAAGIVALENAGYTMSEGWEDIANAAEERTTPARGGVFFHGQDVERALAGDGLWLAFGAFDDGPTHRPASFALAVDVCRALRRHGVDCTWSGDVDARIAVAPFPWRRRRFTTAPPFEVIEPTAPEPAEWSRPPPPAPEPPPPKRPWWKFWG